MTIFRIFLLLITLSTATGYGQDTPPAAAVEEPETIKGRKAWFMCTAIPKEVENPVSVLIESKIHEVTLSIRHMSDPFPVRGEGIVRIVEEIPDPENPGEVNYHTLAMAKVAENIQKALIILVPAPPETEPQHAFLCKVLDLDGFRGGDYMYLNLSPRKIMVTLGKERTALDPGALKIQKNREINSATNTPLSMHYYLDVEKKWKMITSTTVVVQPTRREICVFTWDNKYKRIDYQGATFPVELE